MGVRGYALGGVAALVAAVACAAAASAPGLTRAGSSPVAMQHSVAEGMWRPYAPEWDLRGVRPGQRSLELIYRQSGCVESRGLHATVRETPTDVIVTFVGEILEPPPGSRVRSCPPPRQQLLLVPLQRPLAGRLVRGRAARVLAQAHPFGETVGQPSVVVPGLVGLAPRDAEHALGFGYLQADVRSTRAGGGLRRVVAQSPRRGAQVPPSTTVRISIAGG